MGDRSVSVTLKANVAAFVSGMKRAADSTQSFGEKLNKSASTGKLDAIADRAGVMGVALGAAAGYAVKQFMDFDKQMSAVQAATRASASDMEALRAAAMKAGADTAFSATEAAKGIEELAKAGVSTKDILNGGLAGALSLAAAGEMDVGAAAETAASAMTQFKLEGKDLPHVADLLAAGAGKAQGSVQDMGAALNQAGLIAASTGLSIEDTTGTLAAFANAGLIGSDAGTSLKTMLQSLQAPSGKTKELMDDLGLSAYDASGQFVGIAKFADNLRGALFKLTPEVRNNAMAQIFGSDATRAANVLYENGAVGIQEWVGKVNDAGFAAETAAAKTDNLRGDLERLKGSIDNVLIGAGSGSNGGLRFFVQVMENLVDSFSKMPSGVSATIVIFAGLTGVALLAFAAFVKTRSVIGETQRELEKLGTSGEKASRGLGRVASAAGKAMTALIVLEVVGAIADQFGKASVNVDLMTASLGDLATTGKASGELTKTFGANMENLAATFAVAEQGSKGFYGGLNSVVSSIPGLNSALDALNENIFGMSFNSAKEDIANLDSAMLAFLNTTTDTEAASRVWMAAVSKSGMNADEFAAKLPNASKKLGEMQAEAMQAKDAQGALGVSMDVSKRAAEGETGALNELQVAIRKGTDPVFALNDAQDKLTAAEKKSTEAINKHGEASAEAKAANRELALAALDLGNKATALGGSFSGKLTPQMIATYKAAGLTDKQIGEVGKEFAAAKKKGDTFAKKYGANIALTGAPPVAKALDDLLIKQRALQSGLSISAAAQAIKRDTEATNRKLYGHAAEGGHIRGPGTDTSDSIPMMLSRDEYVIKAKSARAIGYDVLDELNQTGQASGRAQGRGLGYAEGGRVIWPFPVTAAHTKIPSLAEVLAKVTPSFGNWPASPAAQRGDSGVWRSIVKLIESTGPMSGAFGNAYRPGDPLWHGSGRAVDWMGFNQDRLASFLAARKPLELIHRTNSADYAFTRGKDMGTFDQALMEQHRNHVHIAMANGGVIREPVLGMGASGRTYSFGEYGPETVTPGTWNAESPSVGGTTVINHWAINVPATVNRAEVGREIVGALQAYEKGSGKGWRN